MQTQLAHLRPQVAREGVVAVDGGGDWAYAILAEPARGLADGVGGLAQSEIQSGPDRG